MDATMIGTDGIRDLVRKHRVCWEVWPVRSRGPDGARVVAYQIDVVGTHDPDHPPDAPGCLSCQHVYEDLVRIARVVLPPEGRASGYDVACFDSALHYSPRRSDRPDVRVSITVHHRTRWDAPADECESRCVKEITAALASLGAHEGSWPRGG